MFAREIALGIAAAIVSFAGATVSTGSTTGLVAAYAFDEGSGTTVSDASGNGNTGTIGNATWTSSGKFGSALSFNGSSSWVTVPDSASLDLTSGMTLEAWVKPASLSGWRALIEKEQPGDLVYALYANSDTNQPDGIVYVNGELDTRAGPQLPLNAWSHVAATYDGSTLALYVNGTLVSSRSVSGTIKTSSSVLRIGGDSVWGEYFNGLIDEVRIYNRALTAAAIQTDMTTAIGTTALAPANTAAPAISGSAVVGSILTASLGAWSGSPTSYAYEWKRCDATGVNCTSLSGATAGTYTVASADIGSTLRVTVTASNSVGSAQATSAPTAVVSSGLVASYGFDEGSGSTVSDASGNGNTGTIGNATWTSSGKFGSALSFNGSSSWVTVPDSASLDLTSGMTLEAWVDPSALGTARRTIVGKEGPGALVYGLYANTGYSTTGGGLDLQSSNEAIVRGINQLPLNTWSHVAVTYDGSALALYENGSLVSTVAVSRSIAVSTGALRIGGNSVAGQYFQGLIDEVRIYDHALGQAQIQTDMNTPITSAPANTSAPTISGSATQASTLSANPGTWTGSPTFGYQWRRCDSSGQNCTAIPGATATAYAVGSADAGDTIRIAVTGTNSAGSTTAVSAQTAVVPATTTTPALVAAYAFDEGSGSTVSDASGNGNTGTIGNATWVSSGKFGSALSFNGSSSWVTVPDSASLDLTSGMTLEAWVKPGSLSGWRALIEKEQPGDLVYALYANSDTNQPDGTVYVNGEQGTRAGPQLPLNAWSHVAATYDGSTLALYVNGTLVSSRSLSGTILTSSGALRIGGDSVWGEYFSGLIDEVRIYNYALSAAAIQTDMTTAIGSPAAGPATPPAPGPWVLKFSDDFSGSSLDLTKWRPNWLAGSDTAITKPVNGAEISCYDPAQVSEGGGMLTLTAVQRSCTANNGVTYAYASGLVESRDHFTFTYGYLEARMRVPVNGSGTLVDWPAFWADGTGTWPTTGEIDVMEVLGGSSFCWHFHYPNGAPGGCPTLANPGGWHVFGADWEPGSITYYYDGVQVGRVTSGVTSAPMFPIANLGVSTQYGGPLSVPAHADIDYIRVWQHS